MDAFMIVVALLIGVTLGVVLSAAGLRLLLTVFPSRATLSERDAGHAA